MSIPPRSRVLAALIAWRSRDRHPAAALARLSGQSAARPGMMAGAARDCQSPDSGTSGHLGGGRAAVPENRFERVHDRVYRLPCPFEGGGLVNLYLVRGEKTA